MKSTIDIMAAIAFSILTALTITQPAYAAEDKIELETTRIKANQELPQILYVVPWKDSENTQGAEQKLMLHDFFGDLYDPVLPSHSVESQIITHSDD